MPTILSAYPAYLAEDAKNFGRSVGRDGFRRVLEDIFTTFPDWHVEIVETVTEGDSVVMRCKVSGTHRGTWPIKSIGPQIVSYFLPATFLLAAHRAFISWESLFRPAGVSPPFFRAALLLPLPFRFAHRAFAATESFALVAADIPFSPVLNAERDKAVPRSEPRRFSKVPIWRRIKSASSNDLRDMSMFCG
jgi:hypothetical protein